MNNSNSTDEELVAATLRGSSEAFGTLVERHQQFICALAYAKTGSVAASEDIAQDAFIAAWRNLAALRVRENFRGWLCGTTRNLAAKFHRRPASAPLSDEMPDAGMAAPSQAAMTREEEAMLRSTLDQLPDEYREPLVLFYRGGQSVREISEGLGISEDAVKQRLSRGRAMLREAVREKVETALTHSRPGTVFTLSVLAAIPAVTTSAQAAGTGLAVAKGAGSLTASGLSGVLGGMFIGFAGAWLGAKCSLNRAESVRERRFIVRVAWWTVGTISVFMAGLFALIYWGQPMLVTRPALWIALMAGNIILFVAAGAIFSVINSRVQLRIRAEERLKRGVNAIEPTRCTYEYRSRIRFLGLPLLHVCLGGSPGTVAMGWMAYGNVAISPFFAMGGVAIGCIATGGVSVGILACGGIGLGLFSFSALALGGVALGGLAIGWIAMGAAAWGWLAAFGAQAWAGLYGLGRHVTAPHANDAVAKAFFNDHRLTQTLGWLVEHGFWLQMAICLPAVVALVWIKILSRPRQS